MSADIEPLPGVNWSADAVLADAMNRCPPDAAVVVIWRGKDGALSYAKNTQNITEIAVIQSYLLWLVNHSWTLNQNDE